MAAPTRLADSELAACINEVKRVNLYCDADAEALTDVIVSYFTSGYTSDSDDEIDNDEVAQEPVESYDDNC